MTECFYELTNTDIQAVAKLSELYDKHSAAIYGVILSSKIDPERAQAILVQVYIAAFREIRLRQFDFNAEFLSLRRQALKQMKLAITRAPGISEEKNSDPVNNSTFTLLV